MIATEVVLLIVGFISISVSFFVGNKKKSAYDPESMEPQEGARDIWTPKEENIIREQISEILEQEKETVIAETTQCLNTKSNDKIMEFDEFSSQLMEKINHNHEEVVFMYNMLGEKEKELKDMMAKKTAPEKEKVQEEQAHVQEVKPAVPAASEEKKPDPAQKAGKDSVAEKSSGRSMSAEKGSTNEKIVSMYKQGKSVLDISKELNIGQGEVKLMIALYGGNK